MAVKLADLKDSINPINYITSEVLKVLKGTDLEARNNLVQSTEGFALDCVIPKKHTYRLSIRMDYMKNVNTVFFTKTGFFVKYSTAFVIQYHKDLYSTNLNDEQYSTEEFVVYLGTITDLEGIDILGMMEVLSNCKRIYNEIIRG